MPGFFYFILSPIILLISVPLTIFAAFTTSLAISTLFIRVLIVYAELAAAIIQDNLTSNAPPKRMGSSAKSLSENKTGQRKSRRGSAASRSSNGSATPKAPKTSGFGVYGGEGATRDFEGVGGWRVPDPDGEDEIWTSLNYRLELPAIVGGGRRNHHRSRTSGSLNSYHSQLKPNEKSLAWNPHEHSGSTENYFANRGLSKSTTALDAANLGKGLPRPKPSSSSSASSQSSSRTLNLALSNS